MRFINFLLFLLLTIVHVWPVVWTTPSLSRNYFVTSGRKSIILSGSLPDNFTARYYTATFANTVNTISQIYYATSQINAQTNAQSYPGTPNTKFLWYDISTASCSNTHLTTVILGYFQYPYFSYFTYSFLLILANNPFVGTYITIKQLEYSPAVGSLSVSFPSAYQTGNSLSSSVMIKHIKKIYSNNDLVSNQYEQYIGITVYDESPSNRYRFDIELPSYFITRANYSIVYTAFIFDKITFAQDYKRYQISTGMYVTVGGGSFTLPFSQNVFFSDFNMFLGIGVYYFFNDQQPSFQFSISNTDSSFTTTFYGSLSRNARTSLYYGYSFAFFAYFDCQKPYFLYNETLNRCYDGCMNTSYYFNQTTNTCQACEPFCQTCYSYSSCKTCYNDTFRHLVNLKCIPIDGYYQSNINVSTQCASTCDTCSVTSTNCTKCPNANQFLVNNTCVTCISFFQGCSTCNETACFSCNSSYFLINSSYCNLPCSSIVCKVCNNQNTSYCYQCKEGYVLQSGTCVTLPVCGDLIINSTEQCDDGNTQNRDGCDSVCMEEQYYQCYSVATVFGYSYTLYCAYTQKIDFTLISLQKISYANTIKVIVSITQYQEMFWNTKASLTYFLVQTPIPYKNMKVEFISRSSSSARLSQKLGTTLTSQYPQSSLLAVYFDYLKPIHNQLVALSFNFSQSWDYALKQIPPYGITFHLVPDNNHYAGLYSEEVYAKQKQLSCLLSFLSISAMVLLVLTFIFGCKRISSQMLVVFQISYASLLTVPKITPLFSSLTSLSYANNGYNAMQSTDLRPFQDTLISSTLKGAVFYSQFLYNFNTGTLFILVPILAGMMIVIFSKIKRFDDGESIKKVERLGALVLGEHVFAGLVFGGCVIGVSAILEIKYGMSQMRSLVGMMSLIAAAILLALYPIYGLARVKKRLAFEEYNAVLMKDISMSIVFQLAYFYLGLISGVIICMCPLFFVNCIVCVLPLIFFIVTLKQPLFRKPMDKFRTQLNLLTIIFGQIPFIYANIQGGSNSNNSDDLVLMIPLTVGLVLSINFLGNLSFIIYEIYKKIKEKLHSEIGVVNEQPQKVSPFNYTKEFARPMLLNSFIEYSDKEFQELQMIKQRGKNETPNSKSSLFLKKGLHDRIKHRKVMQEEVEMGPI